MRYYIFLDFPKDHFLKETKIPLHKDKKDLWHLDEDEVKNILKQIFEKYNLTKLTEYPLYHIWI